MTILRSHLAFLYGEPAALPLLDRLQKLIEDFQTRIHVHTNELTEQDSILITYGDQVQSPGEKPLRTLGTFCNQYLPDVIGG
ncbi:MAG: hypothetical protein C4586_02485, partial [Anaerolineaceae bacterium]